MGAASSGGSGHRGPALGAASSGGGGNGNNTGNGVDATANTGGGGGGGGNPSGSGTSSCGAGGSGIVIIRYKSGTNLATGGTITSSGDYKYHTFTSSKNGRNKGSMNILFNTFISFV